MEKIIRIWHGGFGDSLQFSTLPRMFSEQGYDVYISDKTPFINQETYDLVWGMNPYVKGLSYKKENCGEIPGIEYKNTENNFIKNWERANGLEPQNEFPEIYYEPKEIKIFNDYVIVDPSCHSLKKEYDIQEVLKYIDNFEKTMFYRGRDIYDYCDWIYSCKKFICLCSGGNSLASALQKYKDIDVDCLVPKDSELVRNMAQRKHFFYDNINYIWI